MPRVDIYIRVKNMKDLESHKMDINYKIVKPDNTLSDFVERFYMVENNSEFDKEVVVIPDGRIDILFLCSKSDSVQCVLIGLETQPSKTTFSANATFFGISFKLLAVEYMLGTTIAGILNNVLLLPSEFLGFSASEIPDVEVFSEKVSAKLKDLLKPTIDKRKLELFNLLYVTNGALTVKEYSDRVGWNSRQIHRYFSQMFGVSLKSYCKILRFKALFQQIKEGQLYPEQYFSDQAHFSREVKKLAGVVPK